MFNLDYQRSDLKPIQGMIKYYMRNYTETYADGSRYSLVDLALMKTKLTGLFFYNVGLVAAMGLSAAGIASLIMPHSNGAPQKTLETQIVSNR
ncbi:MAG TPA: hypothetical protein VJK51_02230 [Candidatus Nanoarchaeia archaeon]|nr:hypothetical protein [Candidatus Nanoarchaeia archaeon]